MVKPPAVWDSAALKIWEAVCGLFDPGDVRRHTVRRPLARLTWPIESAPTERERLRALARLAADDGREADALAFANGWQRQLGRARRAFSRPTAIVHPRALALLGSRDTFRVTDLERMAGCSSACGRPSPRGRRAARCARPPRRPTTRPTRWSSG